MLFPPFDPRLSVFRSCTYTICWLLMLSLYIIIYYKLYYFYTYFYINQLFVPGIWSPCLLPKRPPVWKNLSDAVVLSGIINNNVDPRMHSTIIVILVVMLSTWLNFFLKKNNINSNLFTQYSSKYLYITIVIRI